MFLCEKIVMKKYTRRKFLNNTAKGTVGFLTPVLLKKSFADNSGKLLDNSRVIIVNDDTVLSGNTINQSVVQVMVDSAIKSLTDLPNVNDAWKSLLPGITQNSVVSIKINCVNSTLSNHSEVTNSIINGLTSMQVDGSSFPENNIIIWDRTNIDLTDAGYSINTGTTGVRCFGTNASGVGYNNTQYNLNGSNQRLSSILTDMSDYMINLSVLKNHWRAGVTLSMKNHYGTCHNPGNMHNTDCDPYIPELNNLSPIRNKQVINICDAIYGIVSGGPSGFPQITPKSLIFSIDPVACDYICSEILQTNGCNTLYKATHIATAAGAPYNLGTNDPAKIDLITINNPSIAGINEEQNINPDNFRVYQNHPNPFNSQTTIPYQIYKPSNVKIDVYNIMGIHIRSLVNEFQNIGYHRILWDGKTSSGKTVASGSYLCKFQIKNVQQTIRLQLLK